MTDGEDLAEFGAESHEALAAAVEELLFGSDDDHAASAAAWTT